MTLPGLHFHSSQPQPWLLLESGPGAHDFNMAMDEALLLSAPNLGHPVLRFYGWTQAAASFGYAQKIAEIEQVTPLRPLVRRPTGGGLVPHDADWTYSVAIPAQHPWYELKAIESYQRVHQWISDAFATLGIPTLLAPCSTKEIPGQCFIGAEKYDLLWRGRKIAGAAQRRSRHGLLIQGSIQPPPVALDRARWQIAMCDVAAQQMKISWRAINPPPALIDLAETLRQTKYSQPAFNRRR